PIATDRNRLRNRVPAAEPARGLLGRAGNPWRGRAGPSSKARRFHFRFPSRVPGRAPEVQGCSRKVRRRSTRVRRSENRAGAEDQRTHWTRSPMARNAPTNDLQLEDDGPAQALPTQSKRSSGTGLLIAGGVALVLAGAALVGLPLAPKPWSS